ncbi:DUF1799 domain-containing protein [Pseudorhodobacter sp. E13]|uniref:DUF1799 domain-containing protein n=1 Tax=Pseudorhodobacter sp. E13 TaxID=2487931 RepID=UPI001F2051E5|nr:DUF1799 domain-containing protein [Pseudorhodobacter sp. E13]
MGRSGFGAGLQRRAAESPFGKLTQAGRDWANGTLFNTRPDDDATEAAFWGINPALLTATETKGIWESNVPAVHAFLTIDSQFRMTALARGGVLVHGLDYNGARAGLEMAGVAVTPDLWSDIQMIEAGAVGELNRGRMQ